jgi:hypothetical protein
LNDPNNLRKKKPQICFFGTTTGNRNAEFNERINLCKWALDKTFCNFKITKVAQMPPPRDIYSILSNRISIVDQLEYKYHLNVDGNTCRFDVWPFKTNTVIMKYPSKEMLWYYPFLQDDFHYTEVEKSNMENKMKFYQNNPHIAEFMIQNANQLCVNLFRSICHQSYTIHLFESMAF